MRLPLTLVQTLGLLVAAAHAASAASAKGQPVEQCYFEMKVARNKKAVAQPHLLVKIGADAKISFLPSKEPDGPQLGLNYKVVETSASDLTATVSALVDGKAVATQTVPFTRSKGATAFLEGGGYSWQLSVDLMTPELLERKLAARKKP